MIQEIAIIFDEKNSSKKGSYFEDLVNNIFAQQRYEIDGNINVPGQEFDLVCTHKDRNNEKVLIECKAKESLSSSALNLFNFKVSDSQFTHGIFIYNKNFEHQVQGTIDKWKHDERYNNLSFWNGQKVIELLVEAQQIKKFEFPNNEFQFTKLILFYSYEGFYYIPLFSDTTQPKYFSIYKAKTLEVVNKNETIELIKKHIKDTQQIEYYDVSDKVIEKTKKNNNITIELDTIAEVNESQSWYDYKPASIKYFVGRNDFIDKMMDLLKQITNKETENRVFYIDGKSGWGKSSLLVALKGKLRNKHHKNKYFAYTVDSRSANSQSFISLAFNAMLTKATKEDFIPKEFSSVTIPSYFDIMGAKEIESLERYLNTNNKLLILVFDQFEDIFRKESILKSFFKLLTDVKAHQSNIVLGFSWKSETIISADEKDISRLLSQSKEHSVSITMNEFSIRESKKFIKQLEDGIGEKFDEEFKRRIIDNSQGFPWLVKKLCVHIYKQLQSGATLDDLFSQDLNVKSLFKKDEEDCNTEETNALRLIAHRAYENNMFDSTEINDIISQDIITALTNKNLIIKTGSKYNIYWDIFRDYLVTNEVPKVGETYLIRSTPNPVFEILTIFENSSEMTLDEISNFTSSKPTTVDNLLRTLRDFGLIKYKNEKFSLKNDDFEINENNFQNMLNQKLQNHTFYLELTKIKDKKISLDDIVEIIKLKNNTDRNYQEKTLIDYAQKFLIWLNYAELKIGNLEEKVLQQARNENSFTPQEKPEKVINFFIEMTNESEYNHSKIIGDLKRLGLVYSKKNTLYLTEKGLQAKQDISILYEAALNTEKIHFSYLKYCENLNIKPKNFKELIGELLTNSSNDVYIKSTSRKLYEWADLIYKKIGKNK